jgi:hypothetical protein
MDAVEERPEPIIEWLKAPKIVKTVVDKLVEAQYNPPARNDINSKRVINMAAGFVRTGTWNPPWVMMGTLYIVDGHGRVAAAKRLGAKYIDCFHIDPKKVDAPLLFQLMNANQLRHSTNDHIHEYLVDPSVVPDHISKQLKIMEDCVGRAMMKFAYERGKSLATFEQACKIANYCREPLNVFIKTALKWLIVTTPTPKQDRKSKTPLKPGMTFVARKWMERCGSDLTLYECVRDGEPLPWQP